MRRGARGVTREKLTVALGVDVGELVGDALDGSRGQWFQSIIVHQITKQYIYKAPAQ